ncbi:MAG: ShlB/FhaC/HecB family hemolysin secretion/activation protein [Calothrix sp. SM1_7_51]|nr:ShlB/FhaC/HecB family hemolysin secretion/activation protein [Calothrix sp. SM1_7_51]
MLSIISIHLSYNSIVSKTKRCYVNSGAYIPEQEFEDGGKVIIQVVEGELEDIKVTGTRRLNQNYIRSRIAIATGKPLELKRLQEALQLLRINPLINDISAQLTTSPRPGKSFLAVKVTEARSFNLQLSGNNARSPSVGTFRRGIQLSEGNLLGLGDGLSVAYTNTDGSNSIDASYTLPLNPANTTLSFAYGTAFSDIIEPPFNILGIESDSRYYELTLNHPLILTPTQQLDLGLTLSRRENETSISLDNIGPTPISAGADEQGRTRISAVRFFQQFTSRNSNSALALRSEFSIGLGALNSTINSEAPDSRFLAWRGQAAWLRLIGSNTELLLRANVQLADRPLLSLEQFGIGGLDSVRGYRQDTLLTDNGISASAELRFPIFRIREWRGLVQIVPFIEFGSGWNSGNPNPNTNTNTLVSGGLGLRYQMGDNLTARFDWGIPFISVVDRERTLQEQGLYFSVLWNPF